LKAFDSFCLH